MIVYDAHIHFDLKKKNPYDDLKCTMESYGVKKGLLIINDDEEEKCFWENVSKIREDKILFGVAGILDQTKNEPYLFYEKLREIGIKPIIKIHPRKTNVTRADFDQMTSLVSDSNVDTVIVDDFPYGPKIESHIGTELAIFLAQKCKGKKIVIAHAGGCDNLKTMMLTRPLDNIYYDYSLSCNYLRNTSVYEDLLNGLRFNYKKIMFGTDYPDFSLGQSIEVFEKMCESLGFSDNQREKVFYKNAIEIYGEIK